MGLVWWHRLHIHPEHVGVAPRPRLLRLMEDRRRREWDERLVFILLVISLLNILIFNLLGFNCMGGSSRPCILYVILECEFVRLGFHLTIPIRWHVVSSSSQRTRGLVVGSLIPNPKVPSSNPSLKLQKKALVAQRQSVYNTVGRLI